MASRRGSRGNWRNWPRDDRRARPQVRESSLGNLKPRWRAVDASPLARRIRGTGRTSRPRLAARRPATPARPSEGSRGCYGSRRRCRYAMLHGLWRSRARCQRTGRQLQGDRQRTWRRHGLERPSTTGVPTSRRCGHCGNSCRSQGSHSCSDPAPIRERLHERSSTRVGGTCRTAPPR